MTLPPPVCSRNEWRALSMLFRDGDMSRADLARGLELNRSTTGTIVGALTARGLVNEQATRERAAQPRTGRPGILVSINAAGATFVGMEIGVDHLALVAIDLSGRTIGQRITALLARGQAPEVIVAAATRRLKAFIRSLPAGPPLRGLCVTVPGLVEGGCVRNAAMIGWRDVPLQTLIEAAVGPDLPVRVENDANGFAVAETYRDAARHAETIGFVRIENGAGVGLVIDGRLYRGATGHAGEFGQIVMGGQGFDGMRATAARLDNYIGKDALLARYRAGRPDAVSVDDLLGGLAGGDEQALHAAGDWARWLARGLHLLVSLVNPSQIILGGSVAAVFPFVADRVDAILRETLLAGLPIPPIAVSHFGTGGSALGGALLLHQVMFSGEVV